jgi:protein Tex
VVEDAVNAVGVDLNMASAPLLAHVSGLGPALAEAIVAHRDAKGAFRSRKDLLDVRASGHGPSSNARASCASAAAASRSTCRPSTPRPTTSPADRRRLRPRHPKALMGDEARLKALDPAAFVDGTFGLPTVRDILAELAKPGRDPRPAFVTATFAEGVNEIGDLRSPA